MKEKEVEEKEEEKGTLPATTLVPCDHLSFGPGRIRRTREGGREGGQLRSRRKGGDDLQSER